MERKSTKKKSTMFQNSEIILKRIIGGKMLNLESVFVEMQEL